MSEIEHLYEKARACRRDRNIEAAKWIYKAILVLDPTDNAASDNLLALEDEKDADRKTAGQAFKNISTEKLQPMNMRGVSFNIIDQAKFELAINLLKESVFDGGKTMFCADNLIAWNRNLSFLRDPFFLEMLHEKNASIVEKSIVWRTYILLYFADFARHSSGDFLELGCHTGHTASKVVKKIDFKLLQKRYYLYDLFEWKEGDEHTLLEGHKNPRMYEDVLLRFAPFPFVHVIKGRVPESFSQGFPDQIAFAHIDMNHPAPEAGALENILPRLSKGGVVVFDDYGWWGYSAQKIALDPIAAKHNLSILELPTGQAILLKP